MGTSPALDLANDFAFMHEVKFLKVMIDEFEHAKNNGNEPLYSNTFIEQYANSTKRFIDDTVTVSSGSQSNGPKFEETVKLDGNILQKEKHSSCEIENFVETHLCKLCVILRSRVLRVVCTH